METQDVLYINRKHYLGQKNVTFILNKEFYEIKFSHEKKGLFYLY